MRRARRIVIGAGATSQAGWCSTEKDILDLTRRENFLRYWIPASRDAFVAEHVWEHLSKADSVAAARNCFEFLKAGGHLRIAVPDGFHPDPFYIEHVRPGGNGPGASDHKVLYDYRSISAILVDVGFIVNLLEYWDERGEFHAIEWDSADGHIERSRKYDPRNKDGELRFTSLVVDAIKPQNEIQMQA